MYQVDGDQRTLVSAMFIAKDMRPSTTPTLVDYGGPLMTWHVHDNLCWKLDENGKPVGRRASPTPTATARRARSTPAARNPMVHVWIAPHECGPFAALEGHGAGQAGATAPAHRPVRPRTTTAPRPATDSTTAPAYDPTKPIDLSGAPGVTPEQQAFAENLVAATLADLPQWADPEVAEAAGFHSIGDGATGHEHYIQWDWIDDDVALDPDHPESLVYEPQPDGSKTARVGDVHAADDDRPRGRARLGAAR